MFGVVPKTMWSKAVPPDDLNRIPMAMRCLLLLGHGKTILVDVGMTNGGDEKFRQRFNVENERGRALFSSLAKFNLTPEDITDVVLTHLHFDHGSGAVTFDNGKPRLTFPNAQHYLQRDHLHWALNPAYRERASFLKGTIMPLVESGRLHLAKGPCSLLPDLDAAVSNGHTIGMQYLRIKTSKGMLVYCTDVMPTMAHLGKAYNMGYDLQPLLGAKEKEAMLEYASASKALIVSEHDPTLPAIRVEDNAKWFRIVDQVPFE